VDIKGGAISSSTGGASAQDGGTASALG